MLRSMKSIICHSTVYKKSNLIVYGAMAVIEFYFTLKEITKINLSAHLMKIFS